MQLINVQPGEHFITLTALGFFTTEYKFRLMKDSKVSIILELQKANSYDILFDSVVNRIWNYKWDVELEQSVNSYKIFWDISFRRFIKTQLTKDHLISIANQVGMKTPKESQMKYIDQDVVSRIIDFAIRKMSKNKFYLQKFSAAVKSMDYYSNCKMCGEKFRPLDSHRIFFDVCNSKIEYCRPCIARCIWKDGEELNPHMTQMSREKMSSDLANLYNLTKIIPPAGFCSPGKYDFIKSFPDETRTEALLQLYVIRLYKNYVKVFGSWFKAIIASGILSEETLKTSRGVKCLALDGHECYSLLEKQFDDWLNLNCIKHDKEPHYPKHKLYNPNENMRADFLVNDVFIEIWGLKGDEVYDEKIDIKRKIMSENNQKLLEIEPKDFINLNTKIKQITSL